MFEYRNSEKSIIAATDEETGAVVIIEPGHPLWEVALAADPAPYIAPPEPDPLEAERRGMVVSRLQARAALLGAGLLDQVEKAVNGGLLSSGQADPLTRMAWNEAAEFRRNSPTIAALAKLMGLSEEALDELFRTAKRIEF